MNGNFRDSRGGEAMGGPGAPHFCGKNNKFSKMISKTEKYFHRVKVVG